MRDAWVIAVAATSAWLLIERTETCDRFFDWVEQNPDYEIDSAILAFLLAASGIAVYAVRRYKEMIRLGCLIGARSARSWRRLPKMMAASRSG